MANKRITDVDFIESLDSDESFFVNKNNSIKQINKGNIIFDIVNGGTGASDAETARANLGITADNLGITCQSIGAAPLGHAHSCSEIGAAPIEHTHNVADIITEALPISMGGTGSTDGTTALKNLLAAGYMFLSPNQYGDELPTDNSTETVGRVFYKRVILQEGE